MNAASVHNSMAVPLRIIMSLPLFGKAFIDVVFAFVMRCRDTSLRRVCYFSMRR
jgi:hypothetical protein